MHEFAARAGGRRTQRRTPRRNEDVLSSVEGNACSSAATTPSAAHAALTTPTRKRNITTTKKSAVVAPPAVRSSRGPPRARPAAAPPGQVRSAQVPAHAARAQCVGAMADGAAERSSNARNTPVSGAEGAAGATGAAPAAEKAPAASRRPTTVAGALPPRVRREDEEMADVLASLKVRPDATGVMLRLFERYARHEPRWTGAGATRALVMSLESLERLALDCGFVRSGGEGDDALAESVEAGRLPTREDLRGVAATVVRAGRHFAAELGIPKAAADALTVQALPFRLFPACLSELASVSYPEVRPVMARQKFMRARVLPAAKHVLAEADARAPAAGQGAAQVTHAPPAADEGTGADAPPGPAKAASAIPAWLPRAEDDAFGGSPRRDQWRKETAGPAGLKAAETVTAEDEANMTFQPAVNKGFPIQDPELAQRDFQRRQASAEERRRLRLMKLRQEQWEKDQAVVHTVPVVSEGSRRLIAKSALARETQAETTERLHRSREVAKARAAERDLSMLDPKTGQPLFRPVTNESELPPPVDTIYGGSSAGGDVAGDASVVSALASVSSMATAHALYADAEDQRRRVDAKRAQLEAQLEAERERPKMNSRSNDLLRRKLAREMCAIVTSMDATQSSAVEELRKFLARKKSGLLPASASPPRAPVRKGGLNGGKWGDWGAVRLDFHHTCEVMRRMGFVRTSDRMAEALAEGAKVVDVATPEEVSLLERMWGVLVPQGWTSVFASRLLSFLQALVTGEADVSPSLMAKVDKFVNHGARGRGGGEKKGSFSQRRSRASHSGSPSRRSDGGDYGLGSVNLDDEDGLDRLLSEQRAKLEHGGSMVGSDASVLHAGDDRGEDKAREEGAAVGAFPNEETIEEGTRQWRLAMGQGGSWDPNVLKQFRSLERNRTAVIGSKHARQEDLDTSALTGQHNRAAAKARDIASQRRRRARGDERGATDITGPSMDCTFQPMLCEKSLVMAAKAEETEVSILSARIGEKRTMKREELMLLKYKASKQRHAALKAQRQQQEMAECSFAPDRTATKQYRTRSARLGTHKGEAVGDRLYRNALQMRAVRDAKIAAKKDAEDKEIDEECTFAPEVHPSPAEVAQQARDRILQQVSGMIGLQRHPDDLESEPEHAGRAGEPTAWSDDGSSAGRLGDWSVASTDAPSAAGPPLPGGVRRRRRSSGPAVRGSLAAATAQLAAKPEEALTAAYVSGIAHPPRPRGFDKSVQRMRKGLAQREDHKAFEEHLRSGAVAQRAVVRDKKGRTKQKPFKLATKTRQRAREMGKSEREAERRFKASKSAEAAARNVASQAAEREEAARVAALAAAGRASSRDTWNEVLQSGRKVSHPPPPPQVTRSDGGDTSRGAPPLPAPRDPPPPVSDESAGEAEAAPEGAPADAGFDVESYHTGDNSGDDDDEPLMFVDVNISPSRSRRIAVFEDDDLREVAEDFVAEHGLDAAMVPRLQNLLETQRESVIEEEEAALAAELAGETGEERAAS